MREPRILLTAFEPFDGTGLNASREACRWFLERHAAEFDVEFAVLPVEYGSDVEVVEALLASRPADVLLHTGQSGRAGISVEQVAVNRRFPPGYHPVAQRDRERPEPTPIDAGGPERLHATVPCAALVSAITDQGIPAALSDDAGIYLCNHALYRSLQRRLRHGHDTQVGFLHVPQLPEQAGGHQRTLPVAESGRALYAAVRLLHRSA